jgi:hypothetical protein
MRLTEKNFLICLQAQMFISILNTLFTLPDLNAIIALIGLYGLYEKRRSALLSYMFFVAFSMAMDIVRVLVWYDYITNVLLGTRNSLGYYYIVLIMFGIVIKIAGAIFGFVVWKMTPERSAIAYIED